MTAGAGGGPGRQAEGVGAPLLDIGMESRVGRVVSLDGRGVVYLDERGRRREARSGEMLAVMPLLVAPESERSADGLSVIVRTVEEDARSIPRAGAREAGWLQLTDNQRYTGDLMTPASGAAEDRLGWRHEVFGALTFPFDRVRWFRRAGSGEAPGTVGEEWRGAAERTPSQDTLLLSNGDVLRGFLERLSEPVRFEADGKKVDVDFRLVRGAVLANAPEPSQRLRVWLGDGSVVQAESVELDATRRLVVTLSDGQKGSFEWEGVRAVLFDAARLLPLALAEVRSQKPMGDRRYAAPIERTKGVDAGPAGLAPALDAWDLVLPGPMAVEFALPPGAARLAMVMALAEESGEAGLIVAGSVAGGAPAEAPMGVGVGAKGGAVGWGDCEVSIWLDGRKAQRTRLWSESNEAQVSLDLGGATVLRIEVDAGRYGPIGDRVMLRRPLVLVGK